MKLFFPGQKVPDWIEKVEIIDYKSGDPNLRFSSPSLVWWKGKDIHVRPVFLMGCIFSMSAHCGKVNVVGNPNNKGHVVHINGKPIIDTWIIVYTLVALLATYVFKGIEGVI